MIEQKINDISLILKDLLKVIKVVSMYPEDNPLPQSLRRSFSEKLESIIEDYGEIKLIVKSDFLIYDSETVYRDRSKEESLAGLFFDAGITEITFKIGLQVEEIYMLLDVLKVYMNSSDKSLDLITLFWEAGISQVALRSLEDMALTNYDENFDLNKFTTKDSSSDFESDSLRVSETSDEQYLTIFRHDDNEAYEEDKNYIEQAHLADDSDPGSYSEGSEPTAPRGTTVFYVSDRHAATNDAYSLSSDEEISLNAAEAAQAMGFDDLPATETKLPDTTLILNDEFKLSEEEEVIIKNLLVEDAQFDPYESTQEILKELLLQESEMDSFYETVTICEKIISEFINAGKLAETSSLMQFMKKLEDKIRNDRPLWTERIKDARVAIGSRERLTDLSAALNNFPEVSAVELGKFLENFGWEALNGVSDMIGKLEHDSHKECISSYLTEKGKKNVDIVANGIFDKQPGVVINAIGILSKIGNSKAIKYLDRTISHKDPVIRFELVKALKDCQHEDCLHILKKAVTDEISEIRKEAVKSLIDRRSEKAFEIITDIINDDDFSIIDNNDQSALLKAFSILGSEHAVSYLAQLILKYNFLRNSSLAFFRKAAFEALTFNKSEKCEITLLKLTGSWRPDVKAQAQFALKQRRENIYGGM